MRRGINQPGVNVDVIRGLARISIDKAAAILIPPDHRIVAVADLKALRRFAMSQFVGEERMLDEDMDVVARIDTLIGGDS